MEFLPMVAITADGVGAMVADLLSELPELSEKRAGEIVTMLIRNGQAVELPEMLASPADSPEMVRLREAQALQVIEAAYKRLMAGQDMTVAEALAVSVARLMSPVSPEYYRLLDCAQRLVDDDSAYIVSFPVGVAFSFQGRAQAREFAARLAESVLYMASRETGQEPGDMAQDEPVAVGVTQFTRAGVNQPFPVSREVYTATGNGGVEPDENPASNPLAWRKEAITEV